MFQSIVKKIGQNYVAWFQQSNQWVRFEEPAWFVARLFQKNIDYNTISEKFAQKYGISPIESTGIVKHICDNLIQLTSSEQNVTYNLANKTISATLTAVPYSNRCYLIGRKTISINFETLLTEYYIHPPLAHLETSGINEADAEFDIFCLNGSPVLLNKRDPGSAIVFEDYNCLKKRLYITIANIIYNKTQNDWMSFVHASALTDGKQTMLLSSASGSGKSSMAALLQTRGLQVVSDDFVPIDTKTKRAFRFPAAIAVKKGIFDLLSLYYGNLHDKNFNNYKYTHSEVRYITPKPNGLRYFASKPVKTIVFINYNTSVACNFEKISYNEALKLFHEQAWVANTPENARAFINWFVKLKCYRLEYSDTEAGINVLLDLFNSTKLKR